MDNSVICIARTDLHFDWSFQNPVVNSHMTLTGLRSDWDAQIPFPGPRIVPTFTRPLFPLQRVGTENETGDGYISWLLSYILPSYGYGTGIFIQKQLLMNN